MHGSSDIRSSILTCVCTVCLLCVHVYKCSIMYLRTYVCLLLVLIFVRMYLCVLTTYTDLRTYVYTYVRMCANYLY